MPLEPIDEKDLDLASKFGEVGKIEKGRGNEPEKPVFNPEKETVQEIIPAEKDNVYSQILSKVKSKQTSQQYDDDVKGDAQTTIEKQDAESQIQHLVDIALNKGVIHAVKVAKHLEDNYVLDMFHDKLLSDELHQALMKKGLIGEI
jgi:hypothetical protein